MSTDMAHPSTWRKRQVQAMYPGLVDERNDRERLGITACEPWRAGIIEGLLKQKASPLPLIVGHFVVFAAQVGRQRCSLIRYAEI